MCLAHTCVQCPHEVEEPRDPERFESQGRPMPVSGARSWSALHDIQTRSVPGSEEKPARHTQSQSQSQSQSQDHQTLDSPSRHMRNDYTCLYQPNLDIDDSTSASTPTSATRPTGSQPQQPHTISSLGQYSTCTIYCLAYLASGITSLALSLAWSCCKGDVSGGFAMGAYTLAVGTCIVMPLHNRHSRRCRYCEV